MAILIEKDYWINSQLSLARYYGSIKLNGTEFHIVPPEDDLVDINFIKYYQKLGREKFIEILKDHRQESKDYLKGYFDQALQRNHVKRVRVTPTEQSLF